MYIVTGSMTTAERLRRAAESATGYPAYTVRTPAKIRKGGCSYSVKMDDRALEPVRKVIRDYGFGVKKIYKVRTRNGESVYHAVS